MSTAAVLAVLIVAAGAWGLSLRARASSIGDRLGGVESAGSQVLADPDAASLESLGGRLESARADLESLRGQMRPVRLAGTLFGWLPAIGDDLRSAPDLVDRAVRSVRAAELAVGGASDLNGAYGAATASLDSAVAAYRSGGLGKTIAQVRERFQEADALLAESANIAEEQGEVGGRLANEARRLDDAEARLRDFVSWALPAALTAERMGDVVLAAEPLLGEEGGRGFALSDLDQVVDSLGKLEDAAELARRSAGAANAVAPQEIGDSSFGRDLRALESVLAGLSEAAGGGATGLQAIQPAVDILSEAEAGLLSAGPTLLEALDRLRGEQDALAEASARLAKAERTLAEARVVRSEESVVGNEEKGANRGEWAVSREGKLSGIWSLSAAAQEGDLTIRPAAAQEGGLTSQNVGFQSHNHSQRTTHNPQPTTTSLRFGALIDEVRALVGDLKAGVDLALELPQVAPDLLGANGPKTYLVLGQTSDELRASGGFVSGVWQLTFLEGSLVNIEYTDVVAVDDLDRLDLYPPPPAPLQRHMNASVWLMRDVTWLPDFPSTASVARELYRLGQRRMADGVFAVTPWAFLEVARALGSIPSPDGPVPPERLMTALERGTDEMGREYMDTLFQGLVDLIDSPAAQEELLDLGIAMRRSLAEKQLLMWHANEEVQGLIHRFNWDGSIAMPEGDRVVPVDSNIGWSKVDRNIERAMAYRVELDPQGPARAELRLTYTNHSGPDATGCDSQLMDRGSAYHLLKNTCYWNFLRAYVAPGAGLVKGDPLPLPRYSIVEQTGTGEPGQPTLDVNFTPFGPAYSGLLTVAPGESITVSFVYDIPESVIDWREESPTYRLTLQPQPGTLGRDTHVEVVIPEGFDFVASSIAPTEIRGKAAVFDFNLRTDTVLEVTMTREGSA